VVELIYTSPDHSPLEMIAMLMDVEIDEDEMREAKAEIDAAGGLLTHEQARHHVRDSFDRAADLARRLDRESLDAAAALAHELWEERKRSFFVTNIYPAIAGGPQARAAIETWTVGTHALLAIELFRRERGVYPRTLEDTVPEYLDAVPLDIYTGKPLSYRRLDATQEGGNHAYILYSVGRDGEDNGGRVHERGPYQATRPQGAGFDIVINVP
jgi:hypothetical protein